MEAANLAYRLRRRNSGWSWRVTTPAGEIVASGIEEAKARALEAIETTLRVMAGISTSRVTGGAPT